MLAQIIGLCVRAVRIKAYVLSTRYGWHVLSAIPFGTHKIQSILISHENLLALKLLRAMLYAKRCFIKIEMRRKKNRRRRKQQQRRRGECNIGRMCGTLDTASVIMAGDTNSRVQLSIRRTIAPSNNNNECIAGCLR